MCFAANQAVDEERYEPKPHLVLRIAKKGGGVRPISVFPVADAAMARVCYKAILRRNSTRFSPYSFAYREDLGLQDAITHLRRETSILTHYYLVEFDFSKYFDTIKHEYLTESLLRNFKLTRKEHVIVSGVLSGKRAFGQAAYRAGNFRKCVRGIPQGNCLSLFLANVAAHELDMSLARYGATFARYADDIVAVCTSRGQAESVREMIMAHCTRTGLAVNFDKSSGITEFGHSGVKEKALARSSFDYLGHSFRYRLASMRGNPARSVVRRLSIRPRTVSGLKNRLGGIIFSHLQRYLIRGMFKKTRVDTIARVDWDLVTCINELRAYIYGGLSEDQICKPLRNRQLRIGPPRGILAFFYQISDVEQLKQLDGWLLSTLCSYLRKRQQILTARGVSKYPSLSEQDLREAKWYDQKRVQGIQNDVRIPSLVRAWKYCRRASHAISPAQIHAKSSLLGDEELYD